MTYSEFHEQLVKANALFGDERETALKQLESKLDEIDDEEERRYARFNWADCMYPMSEFYDFFLEKARNGSGTAQAIIHLFDTGIRGEEPDEGNSWLNEAFDDKDFRRQQMYKKIFIGLNDINVLDILREETEHNTALAVMANIPDKQIVPTGEDFKIGYNVEEVYAEKICDTITQRIKDLAMQAWKIGEPIEENALTNLICYINQIIFDRDLQELNKKNIRNLYKDLTKSYRLDTKDYPDADIDIYSNTFKHLCNTHIYLPIEGEVTGMYFFERYYGNENPLLNIDYYPFVMESQIPDSSVIENTSKREEEKAKDIDIKDNQKKRHVSYKNKFLNQYGISLEEYSDEDITLLGDLMNYVEYDFLLDKKIYSKKDRPSNQVNIFLMFQRPSWELFARRPKENMKYRDCVIVLKSEFMRHIDLREILVVRSQIASLLFSIFLDSKNACYHFLDEAILNPNEMVKGSSLLRLYERCKQRIATFDIDKKSSGNIFLDFWTGVVIDEVRHSLGERRRNAMSVKFDFSACTKKWNDKYHNIWKVLQEEMDELLDCTDSVVDFFCIRDDQDENTRINSEKFIEKLQADDISDIMRIIIIQLCSAADDITITLPSSYKKSSSSEMSLTKLLKSRNKSIEISRLLSYLMEKQFYYNFGRGKDYDAMMDFRLAFEQKLSDLIKKNINTDVKSFLIHIFGKDCKPILLKGIFEMLSILEYQSQAGYSDSVN